MLKQGTNKYGAYCFKYDPELDPPIWVEALSRVNYFTRKRMLKKLSKQAIRQERSTKERPQSAKSIKAMENWFANTCFRLCPDLAEQMRNEVNND